MSDEVILSYLDRYSIHEENMLKFFYIKAMLAPCIESLILLDRLVFLQEQVLPPILAK